MTTLDDRLEQLATLSPAALRAQWTKVLREPAPDFPADLLRRGIAYRLQERSQGGLPTATQRHIKRLAHDIARDGALGLPAEPVLKAGTRLVREWHGKAHHVLVLDEGYLFEDRRYRSLTGIAADITGAKWSGPRFFGLKKRRASTFGAQSRG